MMVNLCSNKDGPGTPEIRNNNDRVEFMNRMFNVDLRKHATVASGSKCDECLLPFEPQKLLKCGKCKTAMYCSKKCQTEAWKNHHKSICGVAKICPVAGKGLGMVAVRDIKKGEEILDELPIITAVMNFSGHYFKENSNLVRALPDKEKRKLMSLSDYTSNNSGSVGERVALNGICGPSEGEFPSGRVFYMISRINHSCLPNVGGLLTMQGKRKLKSMVVVAYKDIKKGEELVRDYLFDSRRYSELKLRQHRLRTEYALECRCEACCLTGKDLKSNEQNRVRLEQVTHKISGMDAKWSDADIIQVLEERRALLNKLGIDNPRELIEIALKGQFFCSDYIYKAKYLLEFEQLLQPLKKCMSLGFIG